MRTVVHHRILVTGATGTQGGAVTAALQRAGLDIVVLVRRGGAQRVRALANGDTAIAEGDFDDVESLTSACSGCTGVFPSSPRRWLTPTPNAGRPAISSALPKPPGCNTSCTRPCRVRAGGNATRTSTRE
ncbi:NmrA family NAD(P)-binding protein [Mycobacterium branderi]|nr:NmrA family NAD(P)-binding protein [Mycobacterium branderi]